MGREVDAAMHGLSVEAGSATLVSNTVEVSTRFSKIISAAATFSETPGAATQICCDLTITDGKVTFADAAVAAKSFTYILFGYA